VQKIAPKHVIFNKWEHFENDQNWPRRKGHSLCKMVSLVQKLKMPKRCGKRLYDYIRGVLQHGTGYLVLVMRKNNKQEKCHTAFFFHLRSQFEVLLLQLQFMLGWLWETSCKLWKLGWCTLCKSLLKMRDSWGYLQRIRKQVLDRISVQWCRLVHFTRRKTFVGYTPAGKISLMLLQCNVCEKDHFVMYFIHSFGE